MALQPLPLLSLRRTSGLLRPKGPTREALAAEYGDDLIFIDGHDDALIGVAFRFGMDPVALYNKRQVISTLMRDSEMDREEAEEWFSYNQLGAWVGDATPAFCLLGTEELPLSFDDLTPSPTPA